MLVSLLAFRTMPARRAEARLKPRKAPRQARSSETVAAILDAAARVLEARGIEGFNTNAVAERAGASVGSLYQYFPNKDALVAALIRADSAAFAASIEAAVRDADGADLREGLARLVAAAVAHQLDRPRLARILDFEERRLPMDAEAREARRRLGALLVGFLGRHREAIAVDDLPQAAADLVAIARGLIDEADERADREALQARVRRAALGYLTWRGATEARAPAAARPEGDTDA